jgi:hypothetical protein
VSVEKPNAFSSRTSSLRSSGASLGGGGPLA